MSEAAGGGEVPSKRSGGYWEGRRGFRYYTRVVELARHYAPDARTAIDVGPKDTPFLESIDWVPSKTAIDLRTLPVVRGANNLLGDFMEFHPKGPFDLVFCLQVLEHLADPGPFARKLIATGKLVIISVPYKWPKGSCRWHLQDPVDEAKLLGWTERPWLKTDVVQDGSKQRLIAVFDGMA